MGVYAEYLDQGLGSDPGKLATERKVQLKIISDLRGGRDVLAQHFPNVLVPIPVLVPQSLELVCSGKGWVRGVHADSLSNEALSDGRNTSVTDLGRHSAEA
jgi:hypothetical protein